MAETLATTDLSPVRLTAEIMTGDGLRTVRLITEEEDGE
jgi:hypothetical protein